MEPSDTSASSTSSGGRSVSRYGFGHRTFGFITSISLLLNNIAGIELLRAGIVVATAGWFIALVTLVVVASVALLASLFLAKAIATLPDNMNNKYRIEFARLAQRLFPKWLYVLVLVLVVGDLLMCNLDSIAVSAQIMDNTLMHLAGKTCALVLEGTAGFECVEGSYSADDDDHLPQGFKVSPWGDRYVASLGWLLVVVICLPLSFLSLANTWIPQLIALGIRVVCQLVWIFQLFALGASGVPLAAAGDGSGIPYTNFASAMVFMFSMVITLPSWLNEKKATVPVALSTCLAVGIATGFYFLLGVLSAVVLQFPPGSDLAGVLLGTPGVWGITQFTVYIFPLSDLLARIPVFCIIARYNFINTHVASPAVARFITIFFPPLLAIIDYSGGAGHDTILWSVTLGLPLINFVMPILTYLSLRNNGADKYALPIEMSNEELAVRPPPQEDDDDEGLTEVVEQGDVLAELRPKASRSVVSFLLPSWTRPLVPSAITANTQKAQRMKPVVRRGGVPVEQSTPRGLSTLYENSTMAVFEIESTSQVIPSSEFNRSAWSSFDTGSGSGVRSGSKGGFFDRSFLGIFSGNHDASVDNALENNDASSATLPLVGGSHDGDESNENFHLRPEDAVKPSLLVQHMQTNIDKLIPIVPPKLRKWIREQHLAVATLVLASLLTVLCAVLQVYSSAITRTP